MTRTLKEKTFGIFRAISMARARTHPQKESKRSKGAGSKKEIPGSAETEKWLFFGVPTLVLDFISV